MGKIVKLKNANNVYTYPITKTEAVYIEDNKTTLKDYLNATAIIKTVGPAQMVTFNDGANNIPVKSCIINLESYQEGTGDPSPSNIRPISGRTGLTVTRCGKNLLEHGRATRTAYGITFTRNADGSVSISGTATTHVVHYFFDYDGTKPSTQFATQFPNGTYIVTGGVSNSVYISGFVGDSNHGTRFDDYGNGAEITVTNGSLFGVRIVILNGTTVDTTIYPMIRLASDSNSEYEPYTAQTYPISWQTEAGTVYGGNLDVVSGVLTVDRASVDMGTLAWRYFTSGDYFYVPVDGKALGNQNVISSIYATSSGSATSQMTDYQIKGHATSNTVYVKDSRYTAAEDLTTALSGQTMVYELATPQTYQLTPTEVRTLLGGNTIYTDAGDVSVDYIADTKLYIDNKVAELQALAPES